MASSRAVASAIASAVIAAQLIAGAPARGHEGSALIADAKAEPIAVKNGRLIGVGWDRATFTARTMRPLRPNLARIDASIERLYPAGPKLDRSAFGLLAREVRAARSIGAEPVVILSYTPAWLADDRPTSDRTKVPPSDAAVWHRIVTEVVGELSAIGVRFFEAWNEPDLVVFFQGLLSEFLDRIYRPSAEAVASVERRTGRDLRFGGCACFFPDPAWIVPLMTYSRANDLPLDFISWHHYGNTPFLGPDGAEPLGPSEFRPLLAPIRQRNPVTGASHYSDQVAMVRSWRDAVLGADGPELWIDEWNLSAGGFDRRHDTEEGAAFQAATLIELQRAGLDRASVFRSVDPAYGPDVVPTSPELYGGWGLVGRHGTTKPAWRAHRFWRYLGRDVLAYGTTEDARLGVSSVLTRISARRFVVFAANFLAAGSHPHRLDVRIDRAAAGRWTVRVHRLDGSVRRTSATSDGALAVSIDLEPTSAALVELSR